MAYIIPSLQKANLGWIYYKKYFDGGNIGSDKSHAENNLGRDTLANRNYSITHRKLQDCSLYFDVNAPHGFSLYTTYPGLLMGSGYTHEYGEGTDKDDAFKIGFFFDHITGLPCLPGHSVKGALRAAFPNHKKEKYKNEKAEWIVSILKEFGVDAQGNFNQYLSNNKISVVDYTPFRFVELLGEIIFEGRNAFDIKDGHFLYEQMPLECRDVFHEAYFLKSDNTNLFLGNDYITPHDHPLKNPTPVQFLKVLPGMSIKFQFDLKTNLIDDNAKEHLFCQILLSLGVGAKTNVGYGQLSEEKLTATLYSQNRQVPTQTATRADRGNHQRQSPQPRFEHDPLARFLNVAPLPEQAEKQPPSDEWPDISSLKKKEGSITAKIISIEGTNVIVQPYIKGLSDGYTITIPLGKYDENPYKKEQIIQIQLTVKSGQHPNFTLQAKILK